MGIRAKHGILPLVGLISSCVIVPEQEDVTGISTPVVVQQIRCEMRDAIRGQLAGYLVELKGDKVANAIGRTLADRKNKLSDIDLRGLNPELKELIASFKEYAVVYDFSFNGTITANVDGDVTAVDTFTSGNRSWPFTARLDRSRQNIQSFRQSDTFGGLFREVREDYCANSKVHVANYVYPITGRIGLAEQLQDFLSLNSFAKLAPPPTNPKGPPTFVSNITFTTTLKGTVDPTIAITPVVGSTTTGGGYGLTSSRADIHQVIVAFAANEARPTDAEVEEFLAPAPRPVFRRIRPAPTTEQRAADEAIDNSILRFNIGREPGAVILNNSLISF
ncbi:hypothetical protein [Sinorhizobium meliloti]|uniref:hypothetical protein n=1 Tax=Rhizobium meliloti TaxID=382 RepID=UPI000FD86CE0|nr:hypothetical protein [Sinorhizobium meliloti]RVK42984.1 hypothetical protein CN163_00045 [Sinorhizobium meliloti]